MDAKWPIIPALCIIVALGVGVVSGYTVKNAGVNATPTALEVAPWCYVPEYTGVNHWRAAESSRTKCVVKALKIAERDRKQAQDRRDAYHTWRNDLPEHKLYDVLNTQDRIYQSWMSSTE